MQVNIVRTLAKAMAAVLVLVSFSVQAQTQPDFRKVRWGYTRQQVRDAESPAKPSAVKKEKLTYRPISVADRLVGIDYDFNGDSLLSATYFYYSTVSVTEADVRAAAAEFETLLTEKYGRGRTASSSGTRQVVWLTPRTQITLALGNADKGWSVEVMYVCRVC